MNYNQPDPAGNQDGYTRTEQQEEQISVGSTGGPEESDLNPYEDDQPEEGGAQGTGGGDDDRSGDSGINPLPGEVDPEKKELNNDVDVENADEDELNPYPDESESDSAQTSNISSSFADEEESEDGFQLYSTWMISGHNLVV